MESAKILLGAWISGNHAEHIGEFEREDFPGYESLFTALQKQSESGKTDPVKAAAAAHMSVSAVMELPPLYMPGFYAGAFRAVKEFRIKRLIAGVTQVSDMKAFSMQLMDEIGRLDPEKETQPDNWTLQLMQELERREREKPLSYDLPKLDRYTGGIRKRELTVIAARPATGKTALAAQMACHIADNGHRVIYLPLEMDGTQMAERQALQISSDVSQEHLRTGKLKQEEWEALAPVIDILSRREKNMLMFSGLRNLQNIEQIIRKYRPEVLFIDQLSQLRTVQEFRTIRDRFTYITNRLKQVAMDTGTPIVLLCQVNRGAEDTPPTLSNLKESGSIEEDADNVLMLHRLTEEQAGDAGLNGTGLQPVLLAIQKQRNGMTGNLFLNYEGSRFRFTEG